VPDTPLLSDKPTGPPEGYSKLDTSSGSTSARSSLEDGEWTSISNEPAEATHGVQTERSFGELRYEGLSEEIANVSMWSTEIASMIHAQTYLSSAICFPASLLLGPHRVLLQLDVYESPLNGCILRHFQRTTCSSLSLSTWLHGQIIGRASHIVW